MMKKGFLRLAVVFFFVCLPFCAMAQRGGEKQPYNVEITLSYQETPVVAMGGMKDDSRKTGGGAIPRWLIIDVEFTRNEKDNSKDKFEVKEWLDDLAVEVQVMMPTLYEKRRVVALLSGTQRLWSVPVDNDKHRTRLVVAPTVLARYYAAESNKPKDGLQSKTVPPDIKVMALVRKKNQQVLGYGATTSEKRPPKGNEISALLRSFEEAAKALNVLKLPNTVFPVQDTIWAFAEYDFMDMPQIKGNN